ncbi:MAG: hypothetical protein RJA70_662 [Pseudomonadota bacterium]|jgi:pyrroline-5-carboxylate reductase
MSSERVGFIGGGNMAEAMLSGLLKSGLLTPDRIRCAEVYASRRAELEARFQIETTDDCREVAEWANCVVFAVKPQVLGQVLTQSGSAFDASKLLISVCAGVSLARFAEALPAGVRLIRSMPNTPALVGKGATAIARGQHCSDADRDFARALFESVGTCVEVEERYLDAVTGLSGSGPAYVLMLLEGLADGGVRAGLPRAVAQELALQTVLGTAQLVRDTGTHPAVLKDQVTSPGGTTAEGVFALERGGFRAALIDAVCQASERSKQLGRG